MIRRTQTIMTQTRASSCRSLLPLLELSRQYINEPKLPVYFFNRGFCGFFILP